MSDDERIDRLVDSLRKISVQLENLRVSLLALHQDISDHEQRLRVVEQWKHNLSPVLAIVSFVVGVMLSAAVNHF
jgi:hypothetical protein